MEAPGTLQRLLWVGFCFLLHTEAKVHTMYSALNSPALINIPDYILKDKEQVTWKQGSELMAKSKIPTTPRCECELQTNGSLYLKQVTKLGGTQYTVEVHGQQGTLVLTTSIKLTVLEIVSKLNLQKTCKGKNVEIQCSVPNGTEPVIEMYLNGQNKKSTKTSRTLQDTYFHRERTINVTCIAKNDVSQVVTSEEVNCSSGWDIYLILSVAGGCIAFLIFLALLIYCVKKCVLKRRQRDEEESYKYEGPRTNIQARQLPEPPSQPRAQIRGPPEPTEQTLAHKTNERQASPALHPETKRVKQKQRPPQSQDDKIPLQEQSSSVTPSQRPALPANHPSGQPPKPQPRNQSKPPRQHRKKQ